MMSRHILRARPGASRLLAIGIACVCAAVCLAQTTVRSAPEDQIRPAFLYQLAQYVEWPGPASKDPLRFCVFGQEELADKLGAVLQGKTIQGRPLTFSKLTRIDQLAGCQLAFLGLTKEKELHDLFGRWAYPPVLLVGEADGFAPAGGMVNLRIEGGRVSIEINLIACRRAGLDMRSQLLRVARIVPEEGGRQ